MGADRDAEHSQPLVKPVMQIFALPISPCTVHQPSVVAGSVSPSSGLVLVLVSVNFSVFLVCTN